MKSAWCAEFTVTVLYETHPWRLHKRAYLRIEDGQEDSMTNGRRKRVARVARAVCVLLAAVSLAGCVVVPVRPYHPYYPRYYYYP